MSEPVDLLGDPMHNLPTVSDRHEPRGNLDKTVPESNLRSSVVRAVAAAVVELSMNVFGRA